MATPDSTSPMSSTSTSDPGRRTSSPTTAELPALTTPFVQPPECASIWEVTSHTLSPWESVSGSVAILASNAADERFASCQPSGWDDGGPSSRFHFSPAVCPTGWTYYSMGEISDHKTASGDLALASTYSMAYCCASGMTLDPAMDRIVPSISLPCYRFFEDGETTVTFTDADSSTGIFTGGAMMHNAWTIAWEADDRTTLSPQLPTLTSGMVVPTWVPGETIPPGKYDPDYDQGTSGSDYSAALYFVMIGIPIIGVVAIVALCWVIIRRRRKRRAMEAIGNTRSRDDKQ